MIWINEHKRIWRTAVLLLFIIAITGPWFFDRSWVPVEYICRPPRIRLDNTFCGMPTSFLSFLPFMLGDFRSMTASLLTGTVDPMSLFFASFLLLIGLSLLSTLILIWRVDHRHWRRFQMIVLSLTAGICLFLALAGFSRPHPALWGIWLYIGLAATVLLLERSTLVAGRKSAQGL